MTQMNEAELLHMARNERVNDAFVQKLADKLEEFGRRITELAYPASSCATFLVVVMDDYGNAHPHYCADEAAVEKVVRDCMFMEGELNSDELEQVRGHTANLLEEEFINFEGDPGIHLYRLPEVQG